MLIAYSIFSITKFYENIDHPFAYFKDKWYAILRVMTHTAICKSSLFHIKKINNMHLPSIKTNCKRDITKYILLNIHILIAIVFSY